MIERIVISGFGGQGVMLLGKLLATCAMYEDKFVTFMPAYGAEVRGGTAHCSVIISGEEIASPCIEEIDTLIALNRPSFIKFLPRVSKYGEVFANSSMIEKNQCKHRTSSEINRREEGTFLRAEARSEDDGVAEVALRKARATQSWCEKVSSLPMRNFRIGSNVKKIHFIPFSELALKLKDVKSANLIALGAYLKNKRIVSLRTVNKILDESFNNKELRRINKGALKEGLKW